MRAVRLAVVLGGFCVVAQMGGQQWTVQPEWVKAHEDFLASDAMQGRGSATHDEQVAAEYVASEFEGYGLKLAPGMKSYIQSAEIASPMLDGHATITAGSVTMNEGPGMIVIMSPGTSVSGPLVHVAAADVKKVKLPKGAVVLVTDLGDTKGIRQLNGALSASEPAAVLMPENGDSDRMFEGAGGRARTPVRLAEDAEPKRKLPTLVSLDASHLATLASVSDGTTVSLNVKAFDLGKRYTFNAIGYLPGSDPKAGTILLSAHLDHLGLGAPENGDGIWNGANDDAAGTTAVLELAHALAAGPKLRRSVLFVCYGSEELGEFGSTYFGRHPPVPLKDLVANVEFEMIGNQDPKMPKGVLLFTGWERSNLGPTLRDHGALLGPDPYPEEHFFQRSDNYALALQGVVAHTAAGWGDPPTYHRPNDDVAHLNLPFMTAAIQSLVEPIRWLASSSFVPAWNEGGQPKP